MFSISIYSPSMFILRVLKPTAMFRSVKDGAAPHFVCRRSHSTWERLKDFVFAVSLPYKSMYFISLSSWRCIRLPNIVSFSRPKKKTSTQTSYEDLIHGMELIVQSGSWSTVILVSFLLFDSVFCWYINGPRWVSYRCISIFFDGVHVTSSIADWSLCD